MEVEQYFIIIRRLQKGGVIQIIQLYYLKKKRKSEISHLPRSKNNNNNVASFVSILNFIKGISGNLINQNRVFINWARDFVNLFYF